MSTLIRHSPRRVRTTALQPREGYDLAADRFRAWHWTKFWRCHEAPLVRLWLRALTPGLGLDAGAGSGPYSKDALKAGHGYLAIDVSIKMLGTAIQGAALHRKRPPWSVQSDISNLPVRDGQLDWVLTTRVLSNNAEPERILSEFSRVMKSGAECLISDVHPDHPYEQMSIMTESRVLEIETYRHALPRIVALASRSFRIVSCVEYGLRDLTRPPSRSLFRKIYDNSSAPIFYIMRLERS